MGNDTLCMTGIADRSRHWEEKRLFLTLLSPAEGGRGTTPVTRLLVTALPSKNGCKSLQEPWKIHGIAAGLDGPVWGWHRGQQRGGFAACGW